MAVVVEVMAAEEAARTLGVSLKTIYNWVRSGRLAKAGEIGRSVIIVPQPLLENPKAVFFFDREVGA